MNKNKQLFAVIGFGIILIAGLLYSLYAALYYEAGYSYADKTQMEVSSQIHLNIVLLVVGLSAGFLIGRYGKRK